jgi:tetratricopeptide (TPR) repeat protein
VEIGPADLSPFGKKSLSGALFLDALYSKNHRNKVAPKLASSFELFPDAIVASSLVAEYARLRQWDKAKQFADKALLLFPSSADLHLAKGRLLHRTGDLANAEAAFLRSLKLNPKLSASYSNLYLLMVSRGRSQQANQYAEKWYSLSPYSYSAALTVAKIRFHQRLFKLSLEASENAAGINPQRSEPLVLSALTAGMLGKTGQSEDFFKRAYVLDPLNENIFTFLRNSYRGDRGSETLLMLIDKAISRIKSSPKLRSSLLLQKAFVHWDSGQAKQASSALQTAIGSIESKVERGLLASYGYEKIGDFGKAQSVLASLQPEPKDRDYVVFRQALLAMLQGEAREALKHLDNVSANNHGVRHGLVEAAALEELGRTRQATSKLETLSRQHPRSPEVLYSLGYLYGENGRPQDAVRAMEAILDQYPSFADAYNYLGLLSAGNATSESRATGLRLVGVARGLAPRDPYFMDSEGWLRFLSGDKQKGLSLIKQAYALAPNVKEIAKHYFMVLYSLGMTEEAQMHFDSLQARGLVSAKDQRRWIKELQNQ